MRLLLEITGYLIGAVFIVAAVRAVTAGELHGPERIVHGTPAGIASIARRERPLAFRACVAAYLAFGIGVIAGAWIIG